MVAHTSNYQQEAPQLYLPLYAHKGSPSYDVTIQNPTVDNKARLLQKERD